MQCSALRSLVTTIVTTKPSSSHTHLLCSCILLYHLLFTCYSNCYNKTPVTKPSSLFSVVGSCNFCENPHILRLIRTRRNHIQHVNMQIHVDRESYGSPDLGLTLFLFPFFTLFLSCSCCSHRNE